MKPLLAACLGVLLLDRCHQPSERPRRPVPPAKNGELRLNVTSFNIRLEDPSDTGWKAWPNRIGRMLKSIRKMDPDIMGMQEVLHGQAADLRASLPDYDFEGVGREDGKKKGEYSAIFYRHDRFIRKNGGTFWLSDHPDVPNSIDWGNSYTRIATWLELHDLASGRDFYVLNTHWDHRNQESREKAALEITKWIDAQAHPDWPLVMTGDLNSMEDNPAERYLTGRNVALAGKAPGVWKNALTDAYQTLHPNEKNRRTLHLWSGEATGAVKIDYIFGSKGVVPEAADIQREASRELQPSDHFPVWAHLIWK